MQINTVTPGSLASNVWSQTIRRITGFGTALTLQSTVQTSLTTGTAVDFRPVGGIAMDITVSVADTTAAIIQAWDGTNGQTMASGTAAQFGFAFVGTNSTVGARINNTGANALTYITCGANYTI